MKTKLTVQDIPELPGYMTVADIAERYGINKGTVYHMIYESQRFKTVFKISKGGTNQRPMLLVSESEVMKAFAGRTVVTDPQQVVKVGEWNKRVKQWGLDTGWTQTPIFPSGPPQISLVEAFVKANPDDVRPGSQ